jgi:4-hydroxybenzoate polyprenyltransferase
MQKVPDINPQPSGDASRQRAPRPTTGTADPVPLCVDLDGTLLRVDTLHESLVQFLRKHFWKCWQLPLWLARGRAYLKKQLALAAPPDIARLPATEDFVEFLREENSRGRKLILATGADESVAKQAARHFGIFGEVLASDGVTNLTGRRKMERLIEKFGAGNFDYAGNSATDQAIWRVARKSLFVNAPSTLVPEATYDPSRVFGKRASRPSAWARALRVHQWAKNFLVLVPVIAGHKLNDWTALGNSLLAMGAYCLCASGVYLLNDLEDLEADRAHPSKRNRPFASGQLPAMAGLVMAPILVLGSVACGWLLPPMFLAYLGIYFLISVLYSWVIKKAMLLDVFALAGLYTLRILAGHGATGIRYSSWLLGFSMFLFLSLALLKRYIELNRASLAGRKAVTGRDYATSDLPMLISLGPLSGWLAALVLSLYISSEDVRLVYQHPLRLLIICPLLLYWISRVWLLATRNLLDDDPVAFALKDRTSYVVGALAALFVWLGSI